MNKFQRLIRYDWPLHFILLFTNWWPDNVALMKLRGRLISPFFKSCGKNLTIARNVVFYNSSKISIGSNVYIAHFNWFSAGAPITIGDNVLFGPSCTLASGKHVFYNHNFSEKSTIEGCEIIIENGCWIAANTNIGGGTHIGAGSLLASGCSTNGVYPKFSLLATKVASVKKLLYEEK